MIFHRIGFSCSMVPVISIGDQVTSPANTLVLFSTFITKGNAAFQVEANEHKDVPFSFTSSRNPPLSPQALWGPQSLRWKALIQGVLRSI